MTNGIKDEGKRDREADSPQFLHIGAGPWDLALGV